MQAGRKKKSYLKLSLVRKDDKKSAPFPKSKKKKEERRMVEVKEEGGLGHVQSECR
jgi:hypothetical protein